MSGYEELMQIVEERGNIGQITEILQWDQEVMMPPEGAKARSKQLSTLARIRHRLLSGEELEELINELEDQQLNEDQQSVLREIRREHERARQVPSGHLEEVAEKESECLERWKEAREANDFSIVAPLLQEIVELKREYTQEIDPGREPYRVLFEDYEPYIEFDRMEDILKRLKEELTDLISRIQESEAEITEDVFKGDFQKERQQEFNRKLPDLVGYDLERGKLNTSEHPFTIGNQFDSRITTRYNTEDVSDSILLTVHEFGHALYQLGLDKDNYGNPLGESRELSIHESQSRLWENHVGRSRSFWKFLLPELKDEFPEKFEDVTPEECYQSINQYQEGNLIRTRADEVSYHLHIILRFELERKLVNGEIGVEELPELWKQKSEDYLGERPENDNKGALQDIHWYQGSIGYFPTYSLGSVIAAQVFETAKEDIEDFEKQIEQGEFEELQSWLREKIHSEGKKHPTGELVEKVTGNPPEAQPFLDYIQSKYSGLYKL